MKRRIVLFWFLLSIFLVMPNQIRSVNAVSIMGNGTGGVYINIDNSVNSHYRSRNIVAYGPSSCTWFLVSRTEELTNININTVWGPTRMASYHPFNGNGFVYSSNKDALPTSGKAVAIYSNHVRIIEKVEGNNVLISEGGSTYYSDANHGYCVIRWMSKDDVKNKDGGLLGYIYFPNATSNQVPVGHIDRFYGSENPNYGAANGMIHMVGYAFDYDDTSQDLELHVYVGGAAGSGAGLYRVKCNHVLNEGVVSMHGDVGDHHGCVLAIPVSERGTKDVYVYAIDIGDTFTENPMIGHGTVTITDDGHTPRGEIYSVENKDNGTIRIRGWAYDPDTPGEGIKLHVYVGGKPGTGASHYEVQTSTPSNEYNYEFDFLIPVQERGEKDVYVYALDKGNPFTTNPVIGYGWVNITKTAKSPNGYIEKIEGSDNGTIYIQGWTWDPDDITQDLMLHVYVGGAAGIGAGPYRVQSNHIRCDLAIPKDMCDAVVDKHGNVGNYHGFDLRIPVNETGTNDVYVYAIDVGTPSKDNTMLRHEIVKISAYYPNSISLNKTQLNLPSGTSETLSVNYFPSGAEIKTAWWSSSNTEVATVTNGVVTAKGLGTAVITATAYGNSDATATCTVTVTEPAPACKKPGDFTGDGEITGKDLMRLQRYLVDKNTPMSCSGDVNGDGSVTGKDLMRLQRYLVDKTTILY